ncbi:MAG: phytoene desaturase [Chloroflexaceae bacterium]|nr:phytoene desaturase [Chloroflexaceae bacterium]
MTLPFIIVGGGVGGLASAIYLAAQGRRVLVLEKNERVGGKLNLLQEAGYTFDTGPSLFTMPWIVRDLFAAAQRNFEDYLDISLVEPMFRCCWPDGTQFNTSQCVPQLVKEIERISPSDVTNFFRFVARCAQVYDRVAEPFLYQPFRGFTDFLKPQLLSDGLRIDAFRNVDATLGQFFNSPHLRQMFNRYPTYNGSSPYLSPGTFNIIAYVEFIYGGWYIRGGMYQLARALLRLAAELGIEIRTRAEVSEIVVRSGQARGVRLKDGQEIEGSCVVVNADPLYAYQHLLPGQEHMATALDKLQASASGFILLLGVDTCYEQLTHHTIFFNRDYPLEFDAIFEKGVPAADPSIYVCTTCLSDPSHAPPGHMNLFVLVNAPPLNGRVSWKREAEGYRNQIVRKLELMGLHQLQHHIVFEKIMTPQDMQNYYHSARGAIYGLASNNPFSAFLRPSMRAPRIKRLYFVGGGTHPGGGIPLVVLSGKTVAQRIASDKNIPE